jgi:NTE family protein
MPRLSVVETGNGQRALVLAGGGVTGIAWETGVLLGLRDAGVDLTGADVVIGTSAGATVAAQITAPGVDLADLLAGQLDPTHVEITPALDLDLLTRVFAELAGGRLPDEAARARIGALALAAETVPEDVRRAVVAARLPHHEWPDRRVLVTAVDATTGALAVFDRASGVGLVDAVAASCAVPGVWPPVTIGGRRYIDGGVRSTANADLAAGHDVVAVLAPLTGPAAVSLEPELASLRSAGATVVLVAADETAAEAMGPNPLDPAYRTAAAEEGRRQGHEAADALAGAWSLAGT